MKNLIFILVALVLLMLVLSGYYFKSFGINFHVAGKDVGQNELLEPKAIKLATVKVNFFQSMSNKLKPIDTSGFYTARRKIRKGEILTPGILRRVKGSYYSHKMDEGKQSLIINVPSSLKGIVSENDTIDLYVNTLVDNKRANVRVMNNILVKRMSHNLSQMVLSLTPDEMQRWLYLQKRFKLSYVLNANNSKKHNDKNMSIVYRGEGIIPSNKVYLISGGKIVGK